MMENTTMNVVGGPRLLFIWDVKASLMGDI